MRQSTTSSRAHNPTPGVYGCSRKTRSSRALQKRRGRVRGELKTGAISIQKHFAYVTEGHHVQITRRSPRQRGGGEEGTSNARDRARHRPEHSCADQISTLLLLLTLPPPDKYDVIIERCPCSAAAYTLPAVGSEAVTSPPPSRELVLSHSDISDGHFTGTLGERVSMARPWLAPTRVCWHKVLVSRIEAPWGN